MREEDLPSPEELIPLSQTLISPHLRLAFNIPSPNAPQTPSPQPPQSKQEFDSGDLGSGGDEPARTLKRPRLVWTPQLHKRFVDAVAHLGIKNAVPKTIMQLMSVDGLTRENVASHLQKYRLYLKRMQGLSGGGGLTSAASVTADAATDQLFASSPVPPHFLPFLHHQQMAAASTAPHPQLRPHFHHQYPHRQVGQFGSLPNGQFEHPFMVRQSQPVHRMGTHLPTSMPGSYVDDLESATAAAAGRKALTLFPAGDD